MGTRASHKTRAKRRRPRKRHVQIELLLDRDKNGQLRGKVPRKRGAGRPARDPARPSERHKIRPQVNRRQPQHVTLRVVGDVGSLRKPHMFRAIRAALVVVSQRDEQFRIVHFSVQGNHIHLVCEAEHRMALARGMQAFQISAARHLNAEVSKEGRSRRKGQVFADRYHVRAITSVRETRNVLCYVMNNWRHHGYKGPTLFDGKLDAYSSALWFAGWKEKTVPVYVPAGYDPPMVGRPRTWFLAEGWKRAHAISVFEVPGEAQPSLSEEWAEETGLEESGRRRPGT